MSADRYIGIAILVPADLGDPSDWGGLLLVAEDRDGKRFDDYIPVYAAGTPKPVIHRSDGREAPFWCYEKAGSSLNVSPSVFNTATGWHNSAQWSVAFEEWDRVAYPRCAFDQFAARNAHLL